MTTLPNRKGKIVPSDCIVCVEPMNKSNRLPIECMCNTIVCRQCVKKYLLSRVEEPHCMQCKTVWSRGFLYQHLEKSWLENEWKQYRENILFDREKSMFPATQPFIEKQKRIEKLKQSQRLLDEQILKLKLQIQSIHRLITHETRATVEPTKVKYVNKCPQESCCGYLSSQWECNLCETRVCRQCREIKSMDFSHECNPEIVATVQLLETDSKPCPKCSAMIYRISGCLQMFCTACHTAFQWNTLAIETRNIHNPHYFQWLATREYVEPNDNAFVDDECQVEIDNVFVERIRPRLYDDLVQVNYPLLDQYRQQVISAVRNMDPPLPGGLEGVVWAEFDAIFGRLLREKQLNFPDVFWLEIQRYINRRTFNGLEIDYENTKSLCNQVLSKLEIVIKSIPFDWQLFAKNYWMDYTHINFLAMRVQHINDTELRRVEERNNYADNLDLRIKFMTHLISEEEFKSTIQKKEKEMSKNNDVGNVIRFFSNTVSDYLRRWMKREIEYDSIKHELDALHVYVVKSYRDVLTLYGMSKHSYTYESANDLFRVIKK